MRAEGVVWRVACCVALLLGCRSKAAPPVDADTDLGLRDFARGMQLQALGQSPVQSFVLPSWVLQHVGAERNDLRVFDASGRLVPYAVRELNDEVEEPAAVIRLPFFPISEVAGSPSAEAVSVQVSRRADGTLVAVDVAPPAATTEAAVPEVRSVLIDASRVERGIARLRFVLDQTDPSFVWKVVLEQSSDLSTFSSIVASGSLVSLRHDEFAITAHDLELSGAAGPYFRLSWRDPKPPARITAIDAQLLPHERRAELAHIDVVGSRNVEHPSLWEFDLGGSFPVRALEFSFSESNSLIEAEVETRRDASAPPNRLGSTRLYQVEHAGRTLSSPNITASGERVRYVRVQVSPKGGGLGRGELRLRAHVVPEQLLFLARGEGPFQLAFGRHDAAGASFAEGDLSLLVGGSSAELPLTSVEAGPVVELGGPGLLQPGPPPANRLVWLLWAVLGAAVLLLLWLSLRLWRRIDGPRSDEAGAAGADDGRAAGGRQDG